ncbi:MAG TPA: D-2-hydroxyacid dehydrogenase [Candidatus Acidoferrales bacterium]|nr:D-2-hydroxyacid dehydrogenase [Candidatus Acidoferrales bacterium]
MRIVVLDGYTLNPGDNPWDEVARLGELTVYERTPTEHIVPRARDADVILTNKTPLTAATLAQLPALRFISVLATGYNIVDTEAARRRGIPVSNVPEYGTDSVAQHVFALLLELCHHVGLHDSAVKSGEWTRSPDFCFWKSPPLELAGLTMGIIGFGRIGRRVGALAQALGMRVVTAGRGMADFWKVFSAADVVSLHCPLTSENAGFVNRELLQRMKPSAFFVNTARGGLVDERALAEALNAGVLAGAAVDVVAVEPMRADNPLLTARNCVITPHIAWASLAARRRLMATTVQNVAAFLAGQPINVVN